VIIQANHIFNNLSLALKPRVIKTSPRCDMAVIWIDIWNTQSNKNSKRLINMCFNIRRHITTIRGMNMNPDIPQYKNCWKWGHSTYMCRIQGSKYVKCNRLHKSKHHCHFTWYCKENFKMNPSRLKTKQEKPYPHSFKYSNYKGNYQADSNLCLFWKHRFNWKWHSKKYQEICNNRNKLICSVSSSSQVWF